MEIDAKKVPKKQVNLKYFFQRHTEKKIGRKRKIKNSRNAGRKKKKKKTVVSPPATTKFVPVEVKTKKPKQKGVLKTLE